MSWREHARPIIARVLAASAGKPERDIRRALREAYPFGPRQYHPYKVWCDEVARQRGKKKAALGTPKTVVAQANNPNQRSLW